MVKYFFLVSSIFLALWGYAAPSQNVDRLQQIEQRIQELEDRKRGYEAKALRHENQADRLQFDDQTYLEARRHNQLAEENREKAAAIQQEIEALQGERAQLSSGY